MLKLVSSEHYAIYGSLFKAFANNDGEQVLWFSYLRPQPSDIQFARVFTRIKDQTKAFQHFLPVFLKAVKDIVVRLTFLHSNGSTAKVFANCPVICKLTDFRKSGSTLLQTAAIIHANAMNIERGTKPYMAVEILLEAKFNCVTMKTINI